MDKPPSQHSLSLPKGHGGLLPLVPVHLAGVASSLSPHCWVGPLRRPRRVCSRRVPDTWKGG